MCIEINAVDALLSHRGERAIHIDTIVNNAGFGSLGKFVEISADRQTDMLMVNVAAMTLLTRLLLPAMLHRKRGGILNVGSIAAYQAGPNMSVYYASKAYVLSFTEGLREELISDCQLVTTANRDTKDSRQNARIV